MRRYHHRKNIHKKSKRLRVISTLFIVLILGGLVTAGYLGYRFWNDANQTNEPVVSQVTELGAFEGLSQKTYSNEIFEFKSSRDWDFNRRGSQVGSKYEYFGRRNMMSDYLLTIYIGQVPTVQPTAYVVPVESLGERLNVGQASPHCKDEDEDPRLRTNVQKEYEGIQFLCNRQTNQQIAMVGVPEQGTNVLMRNGDGEEVRVAFVFEDVSGKFRPDAFIEVLRSFQLK